MVVEDVVGGQLVQVGQQAQSVVGLDVVQTVGEYLQQGVQRAPRLLGEHLGQELIEKTFDAQRFYFGINQESAVGLHYTGTQGNNCFVLNLNYEKFKFRFIIYITSIPHHFSQPGGVTNSENHRPSI